jgi:hypothetical protein
VNNIGELITVKQVFNMANVMLEKWEKEMENG